MATKKQTSKITKDKVEKIVDVLENKVEKAKKTTTKKDIKTSLFVEYYGKQVEDKAIIAAAKKAWTKAGNKVSDIKSMELYVKPEDAAVYYVINKTESGKIEF